MTGSVLNLQYITKEWHEKSARFIILLRNGKQRFEIVKKIAVNIVNIKFAYRFII